MAAKQIAEKLIASHKVVIFSKSWCPYCKSTKATFNGLNVANVGVMELDNEAEGDVIQGYLAEKTGQRTVPNVFIDGKHIGGNSEVQSLLSKGQLQKLVSA